MIDYANTTAVLITKETIYPAEVLASVAQYPFAEVVIVTRAEGPGERWARGMWETSTKFVYVQDDDAIVPIPDLMARATPDMLSCLMKPHHIEEYKNLPCCLVGWGTTIPRSLLSYAHGKHFTHYSFDDLWMSQADRIITALLPFDQLRLLSEDIVDLPSAVDAGRMSLQPDHYVLRDQALARVEEIRAKS